MFCEIKRSPFGLFWPPTHFNKYFLLYLPTKHMIVCLYLIVNDSTHTDYINHIDRKMCICKSMKLLFVLLWQNWIRLLSKPKSKSIYIFSIFCIFSTFKFQSNKIFNTFPYPTTKEKKRLHQVANSAIHGWKTVKNMSFSTCIKCQKRFDVILKRRLVSSLSKSSTQKKHDLHGKKWILFYCQFNFLLCNLLHCTYQSWFLFGVFFFCKYFQPNSRNVLKIEWSFKISMQ